MPVAQDEVLFVDGTSCVRERSGIAPLGDGPCLGRVSCGDLGRALRYHSAEEDEGDLSPRGADRAVGIASEHLLDWTQFP